MQKSLLCRETLMKEDLKVSTRKLNNRKVNEQMLMIMNYNNIRNRNSYNTLRKYLRFHLDQPKSQNQSHIATDGQSVSKS
jgi:hypothetical protein